MSKSKPPKPSQQELQLLESQKQMLDLQRQQLQRQTQQQDLLAPVLYETMGIRPRYENGQIVGYDRFTTPEQALYQEQIEAMRRQQPIQEQLQQQYLTLAEQQARYQAEQAPMQQRLQEQYLKLAEQQAAYQETQQRWQQEFEPQLKQQYADQLAFQRQAMEYQQRQMAQEEERQRLQPLLYEASGVRPIYDESGKITSFALTEEAQARKDYENQLLEHQRKALAGELPVDPTLERALSEGEQQLRAQLQAQLGTGYETSTPGIQALEQYRQRAAEARSNVAHGQLTSGQQLLATQTQINQGRLGGATRGGTGLLGDYGFRPVSFGGQVQAGGMPNYLGTYQGMQGSLLQAGSPAAAAAGYQGALKGQFGTLGEYARLAQGFGSMAGGLATDRIRNAQLEEQMRSQYSGQLAQIGAAAGSIIGSVFAPGVGTAAGASLGGLAGGYAGQRMY